MFLDKIIHLIDKSFKKFVLAFKHISKYSFGITMSAKLCVNKNEKPLEFSINPNGC